LKFSRQIILISVITLALLIIAVLSFYFFTKEKPGSTKTASSGILTDSAKTNNTIQEEDSVGEEPELEVPVDIETKEKTSGEIWLSDSISVIPKSFVAVGDEDCELNMTWEEIKLKNLKLTADLNKEIKEFANEALNYCVGSDVPCGQCSLIGKVYYISPEMVGIELFSSEQIAGRIQHHQNIIYFKPATGQRINFRQLLKPEKAAKFDSLVMVKLKQHFDLTSEEFFRKQLQDVSFVVEPGEVEFTLYNEVGNSVMDVRWKFEELQPFLNSALSEKYLRKFPETN
jgi:hypothetical protein